jgi:molybdopterin-dependent oxidoreductase alpha subunit
MAEPRLDAGGGFAALSYVLRKGRQAGLLRLYRRLRSRNASKTCALGMGGTRGGMVDEAGRFPEVCKKSVQAMAGDLAPPIPEQRLGALDFDALGGLGSAGLQALGRLGFPLIAGPQDDRYRRASWDEAMDRAAGALRETSPERTFFYASGRSSNEAAFLLQLVARAYGAANIHNCSSYCHAASGVALSAVYGSGTASVVLEDLDHADVALVAGANPASNHPRLIPRLVGLRRRGGRVIVVNPLKELGLVRFRVPSDPRSLLAGSDVCDLYLQPHVGTDIALFRALLQGIVARGAVDRPFVDAHTVGWADVERQLAQVRRDDLLSICGVPAAQVEAAAGMLAEAPRGILAWAMGLTHHAHGTDNVLALANIALARGWLGKPGAGLLPIRGHSNVQGVGSVGVSPAVKAAFREKLESLYGIRVSRAAGRDTYASMQAAEAGDIDAAVLLGGNLYASNPDLAWAGAAMRRIGTTISLTTHLNEGHVHGRGGTSIVLPVRARDEEEQSTTQESMFNRVRRSEGGQAAPAEARSEVEIVAALAAAVLPDTGIDWKAMRSHRTLREGIARVVPGYEEIAALDDAPPPAEFVIRGRTFHAPHFATADGRARFHAVPLPDFAPAAGELRLMTLRSEGQFNTVVYEVEDLYRGNERRDVVMMAPADATERGLREGDRVTVATGTGRMEVGVALVDLPPGNVAMYYPEANAVVPRRLDERSGTPAFKSVLCRVEPAGSAVPIAR